MKLTGPFLPDLAREKRALADQLRAAAKKISAREAAKIHASFWDHFLHMQSLADDD